MLTRENAIELSKEFIDKLNSSGININHAFLYGSFLRDEQREHSDIDLAIISENFSGISVLDIPLIAKVLKDYYLIHPKTYSLEDWTNGEPFLDEIVKAGYKIN